MDIPESLERPLAAYVERLSSVFGSRLRTVALFGSYARGEADEDSDVDVLVVVDALTDLEIGVVASEAAPIILDYHVPLSPLPMSTERLDALRRGERLLARVLDEESIAV